MMMMMMMVCRLYETVAQRTTVRFAALYQHSARLMFKVPNLAFCLQCRLPIIFPSQSRFDSRGNMDVLTAARSIASWSWEC